MKKRFSTWGTVIIFLLAMGLHSLYDLTQIDFLKPISPVNESVWEHMKMIFFAGLIYYLGTIIFSRGKKLRNLGGYAVSLIIMILLVPMLFYTYTNIIGTHLLVVDIIITFIVAFAGEYVAYKLHPRPRYEYNPNGFMILLAVIVIIALAAMFVYLTYNPFNTPIFIA